MSEPVDWQDISRRLRAPFSPDEVDFRVQGKAAQSGKTQVVAYIDARSVQDRLDEVVGAGAWSFDWTPLIMDNGDVQVAKGTITIHGVAKSDAGTASNVEQSLGAVSHCFKRAAVMWGIGRYLYDLGRNWVTLDNNRISDATLKQLRASLPRPDGTPPAPSQRDAGRPTAAPASEAKANEWVTVDGYDVMNDMNLRKRVKAIGITNMADFETFLRDAQGYTTYNRKAIEAVLTIWEGRYADAQAKLAKAPAKAGAHE